MRLHPGVPADALIEDLAHELGVLGEVTPPVDLRLLASLQSITEVTEVISSHSGCLINQHGQLRVEIRATDNPQRQNFTLGHEICHTLLPGFALEQNYRCTPGTSTPRRSAELNIEWLADVGASELLLPRRHVRSAFAEREFGWDTIEDIARIYDASLEATARRCVRLSAGGVFARLEFATSRANPHPELRVKSASWSPGLDVFIPPNKSIPRHHPAFRASEGEYVSEIAELHSLKVPGHFHINARPYPYLSNEGDTVMRVLLLARSTTPRPRTLR